MSGPQIESETADVSVDTRSFLMSRLGDGGSRDPKWRSVREKMAESDLAFDLVTCRDLAHWNDSRSILWPISISIQWPAVTYVHSFSIYCLTVSPVTITEYRSLV